MSHPSHFRAAVAGTGFIGPVHVEALHRAGVEVVGILGSTQEKSNAGASQLRLKRAYGSFAEILSDPEVDAVHIATPNRLHFTQASAALKAGKHVMCEKPLAMTSTESAELVKIAAESGLAAGVNYNIRYYPLCLEAKAKIASGQLGNILSVQGSYVQDWLLKPTDYNWRVLASEGGELRAVADIGTHWMDLILHITQLEVVAVFADLRTVYPERLRPVGEVRTFSNDSANAELEPVAITTEDYGSIILKTSTGARLNLWVSQVTAGKKNCLRFEISGSAAALAWNSEDPNELWTGHRDRSNELLSRDPSLMSSEAAAYSNYPGGHSEGFPDTFKQLYRDFYGAIGGASATYPTFEDGHREILLCEAILESHRTGRWQEVQR